MKQLQKHPGHHYASAPPLLSCMYLQVGQQVTFLEAWGENKRAWVERWFSGTDYFGEQ